MENLKVILITNLIAPYRIPFSNTISKESSFDFKVVVLSERERNREWSIFEGDIKFDYNILNGWH